MVVAVDVAVVMVMVAAVVNVVAVVVVPAIAVVADHWDGGGDGGCGLPPPSQFVVSPPSRKTIFGRTPMPPSQPLVPPPLKTSLGQAPQAPQTPRAPRAHPPINFATWFPAPQDKTPLRSQ